MDEKRAIIAVAISFVILFAWTAFVSPPSPPQQPAADPTVDATEPSSGTPAESPPPGDESSRAAEPEPAAPSAEDTALYGVAEVASAEEVVTLSNEHFAAEFTNAGARMRSFRLNEYTTEGEPLELLPSFADADPSYLTVDLDDRELTERINRALFVTERTTATRNGASGDRVTFRWSDGTGLEVTKSFTAWPGEWMWDAQLEVVDRGRKLPARLVLGPGFAAQEKRDSRTYYYDSQLVWYTSSGVNRSAAKCGFFVFTTACRTWKAAIKNDRTPPQGGLGGTVQWAGLEDQFFTALAVAPDGGADLRWTTLELTKSKAEGETDEPEKLPEPELSVSVGDGGTRLYFGPKRYQELKAYGLNLEKTVWFSSRAWLAAIVRTMYVSLQWLYNHTIANWGVAIILATFFLRLLLFPLNQFAMLRMRKTQAEMQRIQPKLKAIRAKYAKKKDAASRQKLNEETMALYRQEGINPMGGVTGCLPIFIQFPILIGFYNMLTVAVELRGAPFYLWIKDLSQPDPIYLIPIAMGVTMFVQQRMSMSKVTDPVAQQQQKFMMFMPFMFTFFCLQMPSGMVLYWFVNNLLGIGQQWLVNRQAERAMA